MPPQKTLLLPENYPQKDFFIADIFDNLPFKDDIASMTYPMFTLSKNKDLRTIKYEKEGIEICVSPSFEHGLPTIFDKDILLYCASLLMAELNKGKIPPKTLRISVYDLLKTTNRPTGGDSYHRIEAALKRLQGVSITTTLKTNGKKQIKGFGVFDHFEYLESHFVKDRRIALEITVSDWFYNSIIGKEVLTISNEYFRLGKAIERRLYEIARRHCGHQKDWNITLENLYEKTGSTSSVKMFRFYVKAIADTNHLPDYTMEYLDQDKIVFKNRDFKEKNNAQPYLDKMFAVSSATVEKAKMMVLEAGTGWDFHALHNEYAQALQAGHEPKNINGAFIGFIKRKVKKRP